MSPAREPGSPIPFAHLLWPENSRRAALRRRYLVLPAAARPRLLVDAGTPAASRRVLAVMRDGTSARDRIARVAAGEISRLHLPGTRVALPGGPGSLEAHLGAQLGRRSLAFGWSFGPPRANRKPVVTVVGPDGDPVAYAKIAVNPLTRDLLGTEAQALTQFDGTLPGLTVPSSLPADSWRGLEVLITLPLPGRVPGPVPPAVRAAAEDAVAAAHGTRIRPLGQSPFWSQLSAAATSAAAAKGFWASMIRETITQLERRALSTAVCFGCWHGDWTRHNITRTHEGAGAWDWERFASGVPVGFDSLHFWLTERLGERGGPQQAAAHLMVAAPEVLSRYAARGQMRDTRLVTVLYLLALATRYMSDRQDLTGSQAGDFEQWLLSGLPALARTIPLNPTGGP